MIDYVSVMSCARIQVDQQFVGCVVFDEKGRACAGWVVRVSRAVGCNVCDLCGGVCLVFCFLEAVEAVHDQMAFATHVQVGASCVVCVGRAR